jgi:hypothetical protein
LLVTYADDLMIVCRRGKGEEALRRLREILPLRVDCTVRHAADG